jgi:hypothetical protein
MRIGTMNTSKFHRASCAVALGIALATEACDCREIIHGSVTVEVSQSYFPWKYPKLPDEPSPIPGQMLLAEPIVTVASTTAYRNDVGEDARIDGF